MTRLLPLLLAACLGCGPRAFIDVTIASPLTVPDEVDNLVITVSAEDGTTIGSGAYRLQGPFPQHVILEPGGDTNATLQIWVIGLLGENEVARAGVRTTWREDAINDVGVVLE